MKKKMVVVLTAALILAGLTACESGGSIISNKSDSDSVACTSDSGGTEANGAEEKDTEMVRYIYGETAIPDIPCGDGNLEGKANLLPDSADSDKLQQSLDSMVFETHTVGDYTVRLVGNSVRTDEVNFPGSIYTQDLRVEVEKNGIIIEEDGRYNDTFTYTSQFESEYRLLADRIGSYLDIYDLDCPVIAMRYYYEEIPERTVINAVEFAVIQNDKFNSGFAGVFEEGLGVMLNPDGDEAKPNTMLALNSAEYRICRVGIFGADEFKVVDGKTLFDEEAGVRYIFNFSDPLPFELYTAEKME